MGPTACNESHRANSNGISGASRTRRSRLPCRSPAMAGTGWWSCRSRNMSASSGGTARLLPSRSCPTPRSKPSRRRAQGHWAPPPGRCRSLTIDRPRRKERPRRLQFAVGFQHVEGAGEGGDGRRAGRRLSVQDIPDSTPELIRAEQPSDRHFPRPERATLYRARQERLPPCHPRPGEGRKGPHRAATVASISASPWVAEIVPPGQPVRSTPFTFIASLSLCAAPGALPRSSS